MGMKEPMHEPQGKICESLSIPGPKDTGPHLPEENLVSSAKPKEGVGVTNPELSVGTTSHPG